ncbi:efflux RND transporter periplasmic adaptor subunit [Planctomycetota bacterium]
MDKRYIIAALVIFIIGMTAGYILFSGPSEKHTDHKTADDAGSATEYICSMHPQIRQAGPGDCPICGMDLIPVKKESEEELGPREVKLSKHARILAGIMTAQVKRAFVPVEVRMTGKISFDETRLAYITARMDGRIDRMFVNYTGIPVKKGDHMVYFYSPALMTAQEELLQALKSARSNSSGILNAEWKSTLEAARTKLKLWGITKKQIKEIEKKQKPQAYMTIYTSLGGIVIGKHVEEGAYVKTGTRIYTIADLSRVWVFLEAYESDLKWLKYGQPVEFTAEALPGEEFKGRISFIDPVLDGKTRTVKVRVVVDNGAGKLKPGMFVRGLVKATVTAEGAIVERDLAGKWISPMHPEVIKDKPGQCDVCQMDLVRAETLGYVKPGEKATPPLIIPASAPLITGKRAIVYVKHETDTGRFEGREVVLGPRAGDFYVVAKGLDEGEEVVIQGSFKIDSALQIQAKPSMMSPVKKTRQTACPIMGGKIDKNVYTDYKGNRIYFCCAGCPETFLKDPEKHLKKMERAGIILEPSPQKKTTPKKPKGKHDGH